MSAETDEQFRRDFQTAAELVLQDDNTLCKKCRRFPTHKYGYFCTQCEVKMQIVIGYSYINGNPHWYRKLNETTLVDL